MFKFSYIHCVKSVRIWSYSGLHFPAFGLNWERYSVSLRIQSEYGKMRARITILLRINWLIVLCSSARFVFRSKYIEAVS